MTEHIIHGTATPEIDINAVKASGSALHMGRYQYMHYYDQQAMLYIDDTFENKLDILKSLIEDDRRYIVFFGFIDDVVETVVYDKTQERASIIAKHEYDEETGTYPEAAGWIQHIVDTYNS